MDRIFEIDTLQIGIDIVELNSSPNTHDEYFKPIDRNLDAFEHVRKPKHSTSITSGTLRENDNRAICTPSNFLQAGNRCARSIWWNMTRCTDHGENGHFLKPDYGFTDARTSAW